MLRLFVPITVLSSRDQPTTFPPQASGCPDCGGKKKLTIEKFIEKATAIHGDRYDYSEVEYVKHDTNVTIICPDHGPFRQTPNSHLSKKGCPDCGGSKQLTTETFIEKAKAVHGNRYGYSQVQYVNNRTHVTIICPDHGPFPQTPNSHLDQLSGCPDCGAIATGLKSRLSADEFIEKAKATHGDRYDYSQVEYLGNKTPVTIICPEHGPFEQTPNKHLSKQGCHDCGGTKPLTTETFIEKAKAVHGDRYDYSSVNYVNAHTKVTIICPDHGPFPQTPASHILPPQVSGCPDCGGSKQLTTETFVEKAKAVHGNRYDYSQVQYVNNRTHVTIICPDHGPFPQIPGNHLFNIGCPDCAVTGFNPNESGTLYYIAVTTDDGDTRYKIGITNRTVEERFRREDSTRIRIVKTWRYAIGRSAAEREAEILSQYAGDKYYGPDILRDGNDELFTHDILGLDKPDEKNV